MRERVLALLALVLAGACAPCTTSSAARPPAAARALPSWLRGSPRHICDETGLPGQVYFGCRDATLEFVPERGGSAAESLDRVVVAMTRIPGLQRIRVRGYQSNTGPEAEMPLSLSQRRADAVARALIRRGIDPERVTAFAVGSHYSSSEFGDPCLPMSEDRYGYHQRVVEFDVVFCGEPEELEPLIGSNPNHSPRMR